MKLKLELNSVVFCQVTSKIQRAIHTSKRRQSNVIRLKTNAQEKMNHNIADLQRVENQMDTLFADGSTSEVRREWSNS